MFTHALSDHCNSRDSLRTDKANRCSCGWSSLSGPHATDLQCVRVQRRVDKALTSGCRVMSKFTSSLPIVVHAKQRQGSPRMQNDVYLLILLDTFCFPNMCPQSQKESLQTALLHNHMCSSPDEVYNDAGSQSGRSLEGAATQFTVPTSGRSKAYLAHAK